VFCAVRQRVDDTECERMHNANGCTTRSHPPGQKPAPRDAKPVNSPQSTSADAPWAVRGCTAPSSAAKGCQRACPPRARPPRTLQPDASSLDTAGPEALAGRTSSEVAAR
jgi:hypothetical protein